LVATTGISLEALLDDTPDAGREARAIEVDRAGKLEAELERGALERQLARDELEQDDAKRPDVRSRVDLAG
jgi:hypothetical protein